MPSSSPYQNNDYQAANSFRPYKLPVNDIFKANVAINAFWDAGAQRVNRVYDNALGLSLTLEQNKDVRDKYMQDAEKQMSKLSSMNLADPSVQRQGFALFDPLMKDKAIQIDNHLTKLRSSIISDAEGYKTSKLSNKGVEGEGYNEMNLRDALDGFQNFNANTPRDEKALTDLYQKLGSKSYTPYYDYNKDMQDVIKNCKGTTTQQVGGLGNYLQTTTQSGATDARLSECLTYSLNGQAKTQLGIEGRQAFKNGDGSINYRALADTYSSRFARESRGIKEEGDKIAGRIVALKQSLMSGTNVNLDDAISLQEALEYEQSLLERNNGRYANVIDSYNKIKLGDQEFLDKNYEALASQVYFNSKVDGFAQAFRNDITKTDIEADAVALQRDRLATTAIENDLDRTNDWKLLEEKHKNDLEIEAAKLGKKVKNGQLVDALIPLNPAMIEADKVSRGIADFTKDLNVTKAAGLAITTEFYNSTVAKDWEGLGKAKTDFFNPATGELSAGALQYLKDKNIMDAPEVSRYFKEMAPLNWKTKISSTIIDLVENDPQVITLSQDYIKTLSSLPPVAITEGNKLQPITATDIQNALEGRQGSLRIVERPDRELYPYDYYLNGRKLSLKEGGEGDKLDELTKVVVSGNRDNTSKILARKNKVFADAYIAQEGRVSGEPQNLNKESLVRNTVLTAANTSGGSKLDLDDVRVSSYSPITGMATVVINASADKGKIPDQETLIAALEGINKTGTTIRNISRADNAITVDILSPDLINQDIVNNPYLGLEHSFSAMERVLKTTSHTEIGVPIERSAIVIPDKRDRGFSFKAIPRRSANDNITWDLKIEYKGENTPTRKKGEFYTPPGDDRLTINQIISKINK